MKVKVDIGHKSYPILIGPDMLDKLVDYLYEYQITEEIYVITDDNVHMLYASKIMNLLEESGLQAKVFKVPHGENSKSLSTANQLYTQLLASSASRKSTILAFGGGVVGDLAGFVAATFMRGIKFVQIPTTILSDVDSSVGGKVGVNHDLGKNLIGAFYHPEFVLIDSHVLKTLPEREIIAGFAEIAKYGFIWDKNLYNLLQKNFDQLFTLNDFHLLENILMRCCEIKAEIVHKDEKELGLRAILNFGHTIGHAIENAVEYESLLHGEAIIYGMRGALYLSMLKGLASEKIAAAGLDFLSKFKIPSIPQHIDANTIIEAMSRDKKRSKAGQLWILVKDIGTVEFVRNIPAEDVLKAVTFVLSKESVNL
jgi:3-dehydroquinate synthase